MTTNELTTVDQIIQFIPLIICSIAFAWGNYHLAKKSQRNGVLYVVLTLIPMLGFVATIYLFYHALMLVLDRTASE